MFIFSGLSILLLATGGASYYRTGNTCAAVTCRLTIIVFTKSKVVFIRMDNYRTSPEVAGFDTLQHITIRPIREFNISEITCMAFYGPCTVRSMIRRWPRMPVLTETETSFAKKIARDVNMESMFARW